MARNDPQLKFYASQELKEKIEAAAKASGRSMSAEINHRLETSFDGQAGDPALQHLLARLTTEGALAEAETSNWQASAATLAEWLMTAISHLNTKTKPSPGLLELWTSTINDVLDHSKGHKDRFEVAFSRARSAQQDMERTAKVLYGDELPSDEEVAAEIHRLSKLKIKPRAK